MQMCGIQGGKYSGMWRQIYYYIGANTLVFWASTFKFFTISVVFCEITLLFGTNTVVLRANTVFLGANTVSSRVTLSSLPTQGHPKHSPLNVDNSAL